MGSDLKFLERFSVHSLDDAQFVDMQVFLGELAYRSNIISPDYQKAYANLPQNLSERLDLLRGIHAERIKEIYPSTHAGALQKQEAIENFKGFIISVQRKPMTSSNGTSVHMDDVIEYLDNLPYPTKDNAPSRS